MSKSTVPIPASDSASQDWLQSLPAYARSLLKIQVPVAVTLATTKQRIGRVMELVPGAIIQFEKMCDEALSLEVGDHRVAEGETVKVGDKFGLRITSMILPGERFHRVEGKKTPAAEHGEASDRAARDPHAASTAGF